MLEKQPFSMRLSVTSTHNSKAWNLVVVYGPYRQLARDLFMNWLYNLTIEDEDLWLFMGDFNFYKSDENRNRPGGNFNDSLVFNDIISHLGSNRTTYQGKELYLE